MKRHRQPLEVISAINITNLLDTAFILLVAFMIVAPTLKSGIPLELPKVDDAPSIADSEQGLEIVIKPRDAESLYDRLLLNGQRVELEDLVPIFQAEAEIDPDVSLTIRGDEEAMLGTGVQVIAAAQKAGIENFAFPTEPVPLNRNREEQ